MKWYNKVLAVLIYGGLCVIGGFYLCVAVWGTQDLVITISSIRAEKKMPAFDPGINFQIRDGGIRDTTKLEREYEANDILRMEKTDKGWERIEKELREEQQRIEEQEKKKEQNRRRWVKVDMNVSAYCPCPICCENFSDGITASGKRIKKGDKFVAAPRKYIPNGKYGCEMKVPGYNNGNIVTVQDIGGAIKGNKLDLYFDTHKEALQWGRQHITVLVNESWE